VGRKKLAVFVAICASLGLMFSSRSARAMTEAATVAIVGNHPHISLTPDWHPAATDWMLNLRIVLALHNQVEMKKLKAELQMSGSPNYHTAAMLPLKRTTRVPRLLSLTAKPLFLSQFHDVDHLRAGGTEAAHGGLPECVRRHQLQHPQLRRSWRGFSLRRRRGAGRDAGSDLLSRVG
jgi:hypothetical protein